MTQEEKDLLIKDLCARLPYSVQCCAKNNHKISGRLVGIIGENVHVFSSGHGVFSINIIKPYLFPLSSMTDEEEEEYNILRDDVQTYHYEFGDVVDDVELCDNWESIDYLNAHHFDFRGLIEKELAIDATGLNIY